MHACIHTCVYCKYIYISNESNHILHINKASLLKILLNLEAEFGDIMNVNKFINNIFIFEHNFYVPNSNYSFIFFCISQDKCESTVLTFVI